MSQFLRILLLVLIFLFLFRVIKRFLVSLFKSSTNKANIPPDKRERKKYENIEEAKYTNISDEDQEEKNN